MKDKKLLSILKDRRLTFPEDWRELMSKKGEVLGFIAILEDDDTITLKAVRE